MKRLLVAAIAGVGTSLALAVPAAADTTSIADVGNDNLGYSVGTTGGSVAVGGTRTTVDGFGTLHGSTVITQGSDELFSIRQSYDNGFQSTTSFNNGQTTQSTELNYYGGFESEWNSPNGSFELYCAPLTGCTTGSG
jgi:hypothetical protein